MQQSTTQPMIIPTVSDELILVVPRADILPHGSFHGLQATTMQEITGIIASKKQFLPRSIMETDPTYKQIIPYLIYTHNEKYFLMQRHAKASESRLRSKFSFGIGGHIRQEDMQTDSIFDWARREFHEEVNYNGNLTIQPIGLLNDDSNEVGKVHIGLVMLLMGDREDISVQSELQSGELISLADAEIYKDHMESWSQIVFEYLKNAAPKND
ncbi:MAG TPA: hypothetical protein VGT41_01250 [Candidatus Babeliales bacterium]|nr:hypothetical protein [Candidatus Babeliales bacterium]